MKLSKVLVPVFGLAFASAALGTGGGGETPFGFSFTADGGAIPDIDLNNDNEGISAFSLTMVDPRITQILSLELVLTGLTHTEPADLDIYLIDPFGETLEVMTDRGDSLPIIGVNLIFNDGAEGQVPENGQIVSGTFLTEFEGDVPPPQGGLGQYLKQSGGTDAWILLIIDDSAGDSGSLSTWTLRGTGVPEPMTLSLLAVGGIVALIRRRPA